MADADGQRHVGEVLADYDGDRFSVGVLDHNDSRRLDAARLILNSEFEPDWSSWREREAECIAAVAPLLRPIRLRQHLTEPYHEHTEECGGPEAIDRFEEGDASGLTCGQEERSCGCEDIGWWCDEGDGPETLWFELDRSVVDEALEPLYLAWMAEEDRA